MDVGRSSAKLFIARSLSTIIGFAALAFFTRELSSQQLGAFFLFQALLGALTIPGDLGISSAVTKRISEGQPLDSIFSSAATLKLGILAILVAGILLLRSSINAYLGTDLALFLAVGLILQGLANLSKSALEGERRVGETALPILTDSVIYAVLGAGLVVIGIGVIGLVYALLAGLLILFVWYSYKIRPGFEKPSLLHIRSLIDYSKFAAISSVGGFLYSWLDVLVIGLFLTQSDVSTYEVAWRVTAVVMLLSKAIASTIFPEVSKLDAENRSTQVEDLITRSITPSMLFVIPAFVGTILFSKEILSLVFAPEYAAAWLVLIVLMADQITESVHVIIGRSLGAIDRPDLSARATAIGVVANVVLNVILVWELGILGAAIGTLAASFLTDSLHAVYLSRFITIRFPWADIAWCTLCSVAMGVVLLSIKRAFVIETLPTLVATILLGAGLYLGSVMLSPSIREKTVRQIR